MGNSWKAVCVEKGSSRWDIGDIIRVENGVVVECIAKRDDGDFIIGSSNEWFKTFNNWSKATSKTNQVWELLEETITQEEVIELLNECVNKHGTTWKEGYINTVFSIIEQSEKIMTMTELIKYLSDYKKSKLITSITKQEYDDIAKVELDKLYPNGWKIEE